MPEAAAKSMSYTAGDSPEFRPTAHGVERFRRTYATRKYAALHQVAIRMENRLLDARINCFRLEEGCR
jgi:hypothetical protein